MQEITLPQSFFGTDSTPPKNKDIMDSLSHIMETERDISEKAFDAVNELMKESEKIVNKYESLINECRSKNQRIEYIAEQIYDKEFNDTKKTDIDELGNSPQTSQN